MRKIRTIAIEKVKGIDSKTFNLDLLPNKPSLLVAPNGFGKSSFTTAFNKLNNNGIKLDKDTFFKNEEANKPKLTIVVENDDGTQKSFMAEENVNTIKNEFDYFVINSLLISKHKKQTFQGKTVVSSSIEVAPITLIDKVPPKQTTNYTPTNARKDFGANGKILPNLSTLLTSPSFVGELVNTIDFSKFDGSRISTAISTFTAALNNLTGNSAQILAAATAYLPDLKAKSNLDGIVVLIDKHNSALTNEVEKYISAVSILQCFQADKERFLEFGKYCEYLNEKADYDELFKSFNATWRRIKPVEVQGQLIVQFPKANQISNGERDVIAFISQLIRAARRLKKKNSILIIDEVFDYLDDANLITAQYYITKLIARFKGEGRNIYPLIMTHLNPYYFNNFSFSDQKIYYLNKSTPHINRDTEKLIFERENPAIKSDIDSYFLHHNPNDTDISSTFASIGLNVTYGKSANFKAFINGEVAKYLQGRSTFDPISVCLAVRLKVEEKAYLSLVSSAEQTAFLATHKTINKLNFAKDKGSDIPEIFYLLGVVYNEMAHIRPNIDYGTPIKSKLSNRIVMNMVKQVFT